MIDHEEYVNTLDAFGDDVLTDAILTRSFPENFSGDLIDDKIIKVGAYSLYGCNDIVNVYFPLATIVQTSGLAYSMNLLSVDMPECTEVVQSGFQHCEKLVDVNMILSILVDTFISKISLPMQPVPEIGSISVA